MSSFGFSDERLKVTLDKMQKNFEKTFGSKDVEWLIFSFAPGRLNLIGEHVDYMGGWVCPAALENGTNILVGRVKSMKHDKTPKLRFFSTFNREYFELDTLGKGHSQTKNWKNYIRGAVTLRLDYLGVSLDHPSLQGVCFFINSTIPVGAGLSTSAALGVALINAVNALVVGDYNRKFENITSNRAYRIIPPLIEKEKKMVAQQARLIEEEYCGVKVGIMGHFCASLSERDKFMILDCSDLSHQLYPFNKLIGDEYCFVIFDSMIQHDLSGTSKEIFNSVRLDQENAQKKISANLCKGEPFTFTNMVRQPYKYAKDGNIVRLFKQCDFFLSKSEYEKGLYQIEEQLRTIKFRRVALDEDLSQEEKVKALGALLNESHKGMKELLNITIPQIDFIQEFVVGTFPKEVLGAKMIGAGFGGSVLTLMRKSAVDHIAEELQRKYKSKTNIFNKFYTVEHGGGGMFVVSLLGSPESHF